MPSSTRFCIFEVGSGNDLKIVEDHPDAVSANERAKQFAKENGATHMIVAAIVVHPDDRKDKDGS